MATLTQATASYVVDETVSVLAFDEFVQEPAMMPALFNQQPSSKPSETRGSISALGDFTEKTELADPDEDSPVQQFKSTVNHTEYAKLIKIERKVIDDQMFDFFGQMGMKIGQSAVRSFEKLAAAALNNAFSSSLSEDGLTLCNGAHVNADSGNSQSNSGTTALSWSSAGTTRTAMRNYTDYRANEIVVNPDLLIVPTGLEQTAFEIVRSSGDPTSANLKANFHNGRYSVVVWDYLTDANNWFMADSRLMKQNLVWFWRMALEIYGDGDLFKGLRRIGGYFRSSHDIYDWRWIYGHNVT